MLRAATAHVLAPLHPHALVDRTTRERQHSQRPLAIPPPRRRILAIYDYRGGPGVRIQPQLVRAGGGLPRILALGRLDDETIRPIGAAVGNHGVRVLRLVVE